MKKTIAILFTVFSVSACAHGPSTHGHSNYGHRHHDNTGAIVAGIILGATAGYVAGRSQPAPQPAPVIIETPQPVPQFYPYGHAPMPGYQFQNCGPWRDYVTPNGQLIRGRYCY